MPVVCSVKFPYAARDLWFDANGHEPLRGQSVICETERGLEYGVVTGESHEVDDKTLESTTGGAELKPIVRLATAEDDELADDLEAKGEEAMGEFTQQVEELGLDMKPVGVEFLFGGEGAVCYFVAENRVDFRQLARNLSRTLQSRVDLRQIGVREQASIMGGMAHCGQEYCCARLGQGFGPVTIRMAKDQDLPLNSPKISGACGRLMCCLRYEDEAYKDFKKRAPKKNAVIETPFGDAKVSEFDTPREAVGLRLEDNRTIRVPLASMECSEAARERAARNGAPCRPDCVTFDALERLESPQVKLALAQLRAETELTEEDWMPKEDILVVEEEAKAPERQGRRRRGANAEAGGETEEAAPRGRRRRRRGRLNGGQGSSGTHGVNGEKAAEGERQQGGKGQNQGAAKDQNAPKGQGQRSGSGKASRRRHHSQDGTGANRQQRRPRQRTDLSQKSKRPNAPKDATQTSEPKANTSPQPKRQRQPKKQAQQQPQRAPKAQAQGQPKPAEDRKPGRARRRRRRHGNGGAAGGGAPQSAS